ncbi:restriction endonuclease subunit S [Vibrio sp. D173a]|uniref:restriction endonuclease subunit S n=1 Tax=Vibrio sp. D173a TaxID=2836349 RepID=UPI002555FD84|nr:restriction endonuclease subunit S [Vibrio sp. D173a]MDK9754077.1 restriction endonuclease subunit S [Vibrio sp. D173a]
MLVPELRFPEFTGKWNKKELGQLSKILRGGSPRPIDDFLTKDKNALNWLKIGDVDKDAKYISMTQERVKVEALSKTRVVNSGDLIMSNSMSFGRPYIMKIQSCIHDGWIAVTDVSQSIDVNYLYYFILSDASQGYFVNSAAGGGIKNLNADIVKKTPISYAEDTKEQKKIADCLSSMDDLITKNTKKLDSLKLHKKGLMQKLFPEEGKSVPELRFSGFNEGWKETKVENVCYLQAGKFVKAANIKSKESDRLYPCYGGNGLRGFTESFTHDGAYSLIGRQGALCGNVNFVTGRFHATEHAVVVEPKENVDNSWLYYELCRLNLNRFATGQAQPGLSVENLNRVDTFVPKLKKEQQKISECLFTIDDLIKNQSKKVEVLKEHKKGLMQRLFPSNEGAIV